jgi:autotransporter-associated beta strand protein
MAAINWKAPVDGNWNVAANWSPGVVPTSGDDVTIAAAGLYTVTISSNGVIVHPLVVRPALIQLGFPDEAKSLTFDAPNATLQENAGALDVVGALTVDSGSVSLNEANTIGSVTVTGGVLAFGAGGALGAGTVSLSGGELLATASETLSNGLSFSGSSDIAAAHGTTLSAFESPSISPNSTLNFGAPGQDGIVSWAAVGFAISKPITVNVVAGTLKAASSSTADILDFVDQPTTVDAGATLDTGGFSVSLASLLGAGAVIDSGAAATLTIGTALFSGTISGSQSLVVNGPVTLTGSNTYTGTTTIGSGGNFELGLGGTTGSIAGGAIVDGGALYVFRGNAITLTNAISGGGVLRQVGPGVTSINTVNTYTGGTFISAGTLAIGNGAALGTGTVTDGSAELLATANETVTNDLVLSGSSTIAAAHGKTLNEDSSFYTIDANSTLNFGAPGDDGTILWHTGNASINLPDPVIDVQAGTLKGADSEFTFLISGAPQVTVAAGATLDTGGSGLDLADLLGGGVVSDSGAAATLTLNAVNFSGAISGALSVEFNDSATLSGLEDYSGSATFGGTLTNTGTYDLVANSDINGGPAASFINNALFEKTGSGGVSDVTSNFVNSGTLNVLSGSIAFSGGFTNHGVIHGLVTHSGGVTTISAPVSTDFNGDSKSDILWQNADGQASIWDMNANTLTGGGPVSPNPGTSWTEM